MKPQFLTQNLLIKEIFHSLQGEGGRAGENSIFIRLANCNLNCSYCDTDWTQGDYLSIETIISKIKEYKSNWITWTGGEPTLQLTTDIVSYFKGLGFKQSIETNGSNPVPAGIDYIACSPKVSIKKLNNSFPNGLDEIRYPIKLNQKLPPVELLPKAQNYYISPIFKGNPQEKYELDYKNLEYCINLIKNNPQWKLSIQQHKIWKTQ